MESEKPMILGIDLGSSVSKAVLLDESLHLQDSAAAPTKGNFSGALKFLLGAVLGGQTVEAVKIAITGSGRESFSFPADTILVNDLVALAQRIRKDFRNIPIPTLIYIGTESAVEQTRLEAFVYQVQQYAKKRISRETVLARP